MSESVFGCGYISESGLCERDSDRQTPEGPMCDDHARDVGQEILDRLDRTPPVEKRADKCDCYQCRVVDICGLEPGPSSKSESTEADPVTPPEQVGLDEFVAASDGGKPRQVEAATADSMEESNDD